MFYRISNRTSGQDMGVYSGATEDEALQDMLNAAGDAGPLLDRSDWLLEPASHASAGTIADWEDGRTGDRLERQAILEGLKQSGKDGAK